MLSSGIYVFFKLLVVANNLCWPLASVILALFKQKAEKEEINLAYGSCTACVLG